MERNKKDIKGKGVPVKWIAVILLAVVVLLLGGSFMGLYLAGYRRKTVEYVNSLEEGNQSITFMGFLDKDGNIKKGTLYYDTKKAEVRRGTEGNYILTYSNGDIYTGPLDGFQRQGIGTMEYANGNRYEGAFAADRLHGYGVFTYAGNDSYAGYFSAGKKSGEGTYTWYEDGEVIATYTGSFKNDRRNGYGVFVSSDGSYYKGNFVNDVRTDDSAEACIVNRSGGIDRYYGGYENDMLSGFGYYFYESGSVYVGSFSANRPHGQGTIYLASGESSEGTFVNGELKKSEATVVPEEDVSSFFEKLDQLEEQLKGN